MISSTVKPLPSSPCFAIRRCLSGRYRTAHKQTDPQGGKDHAPIQFPHECHSLLFSHDHFPWDLRFAPDCQSVYEYTPGCLSSILFGCEFTLLPPPDCVRNGGFARLNELKTATSCLSEHFNEHLSCPMPALGIPVLTVRARISSRSRQCHSHCPTGTGSMDPSQGTGGTDISAGVAAHVRTMLVWLRAL